MPRAALLPWLYQVFPYLMYDHLSPEEFSDADLNSFFILYSYNMTEGEEITKRLVKRHEEVQKREEDNIKASLSKPGYKKGQQDYYSQSMYGAGQYQYDPSYYAYAGYDPNVGQQPQPQQADYYSNAYYQQPQVYQPQVYQSQAYQNQPQPSQNYRNNYNNYNNNNNYNEQGYDNQRYNQGYKGQGYKNQGYEQGYSKHSKSYNQGYSQQNFENTGGYSQSQQSYVPKQPQEPAAQF